MKAINLIDIEVLADVLENDVEPYSPSDAVIFTKAAYILRMQAKEIQYLTDMLQIAGFRKAEDNV